MTPEIFLYKSCADCAELSTSSKKGKSIFFITPKGLDVSSFSILQAIASLTGLKFGRLELPPASKVMIVDGCKSAGEIRTEVATCEYEKDLSKILVLSMASYNVNVKASPVDPDIPVVEKGVVDALEKFSNDEDQAYIIFHDLYSLSAGGTLFKASDLRDLHNRLKARGSIQLFFVNSETEAMQIAIKPDLVFVIAKNSEAELHPTIKVSLHSASVRLQDTFLPIELELLFGEHGTWRVETSISEVDQEHAIRYWVKRGKTHKEIAQILGCISATTVGRRIKDMKERDESIIKGNKVRDAKKPQ